MIHRQINQARVTDLQAAMSGYVSRGDVPGMVTLIARGDEVHVDAVGMTTLGGSNPMRRDTIFRIASITKPVTAAAVMMLIDDGKLRLDDAIDRWLPELSNRRVLKRIDAQLDDTVAARRPLTVRDLLTFCMGFGSVLAPPDTYPIQKPIRDGHLGGDGPPDVLNTPRAGEWIRRLGELPLMYQPGERWLYNTSSDVLGVLIARVAGKSFEAFLQERLLGPLGMHDTAFSVPAEKVHRLAGMYQFDHAARTLREYDGVATSVFRHPPPFESGAGGLVSTIDDYYAFSRMMLNKGVHGSLRLLSESAIENMTRDQLTPQQRVGTEIFFGKHTSWGLGMAVNIHREKPWQVPGRFGWDGGYGTSAWSDPQNDFIGILLTQRLMDSPEPPAACVDFWREAYRAIEV
jgi:CubicO group peptidase (beta-lactamase class C family)